MPIGVLWGASSESHVTSIVYIHLQREDGAYGISQRDREREGGGKRERKVAKDPAHPTTAEMFMRPLRKEVSIRRWMGSRPSVSRP